MKSTSLLALVQEFFVEWMGQQRNLSPNTVRSYRDTWKLYLRFVSEHLQRPVQKLTFTDLDETTVLAFLNYVEHERKVSIGTRNCRLAALRSFFSYMARRDPSGAFQCAKILGIPTKKCAEPEMCYMDPEEVSAVLAQPDRATLGGMRDHAFMSLLYNTGARVQEALDLCPKAIRFESPAQVRLFGKGGKERFCPLWPETVAILKGLLKRQPRGPDEPIFLNRRGDVMGAAGVRSNLEKYVKAASDSLPSLKSKSISPHTFRHSVGVHLIRAGVDITVIRNILGHASITTTSRYARADLETKRKALGDVPAPSGSEHSTPVKRDADILNWLDTL